jgi:hypothetical protein
MDASVIELSDEEMARLSVKGQAIYDERIKHLLESAHNGETIAIHLDSGDYAVGRSFPVALRTLRLSQPEGLVMTMIIGPEREDPTLDLLLGRRPRPVAPEPL